MESQLSIEEMSDRELGIARQRVIEALLADDMPRDAFERVAILEERRADSSNPLVIQLIRIEEAQEKLAGHPPQLSVECDQSADSTPTPALLAFLKALLHWESKSKKPDEQ